MSTESHEPQVAGDVAELRERPEHIEIGAWALLKRQAARSWHVFGEPVLLAGSAVRKAEPRDWDIRISLPDDVFAARYGDPEEWATTGETGEWTLPRQRTPANGSEKPISTWTSKSTRLRGPHASTESRPSFSPLSAPLLSLQR